MLTFDEGLQFVPPGRRTAASLHTVLIEAASSTSGCNRLVKSTRKDHLGSGANWQPDWSPTRDLLTFRSEQGDGGIFVMPAHGGPQKKIASFGYHPRWSPDGRHILIDSTYFP